MSMDVLDDKGQQKDVTKARRKHLTKLTQQFKAVKEVPRSSAATKPLTTRWADRKTGVEVEYRLTVHGLKQHMDPGTKPAIFLRSRDGVLDKPAIVHFPRPPGFDVIAIFL